MGATESQSGESFPLVRPLDDEQARLVEILRSAAGNDVSFEELRRRGIENPAVLAYELEIAGLPISHVHRPRPGGGPTSVGLRLDATVDATLDAGRHRRGVHHARGDLAGAADSHRRSGPRERPRPGLLPVAVTAVAAFVLIVLVVALIDGTGNGGGTNQPAKLALEGSHATPSAPATHQGPAAPPPASHARHHPPRSSRAGRTEPAAPLSPAAKLALAGGQLLQEGRYAAAIPELRSALSASGESASSCTVPTGAGCVAYAEALYDLGRALRLDNAPAAAGAVLRARLQIDTQRAAVRHELGLNSKPQTRAPATRRSTHTTRPHGRTTTPAAPAKPQPNTGGAAAPVATAR